MSVSLKHISGSKQAFRPHAASKPKGLDDRANDEAPRDLFAAIVESSADAILALDRDGVIVSFNRAAERVFGQPARAVIGQSVRSIFPAEYGPSIDRNLERLRRGEPIPIFETTLVRADGVRFALSLCASPLRDPRGATYGASVIARDITDQKEAEQVILTLNRSLSRRVEELQTLLDVVPVGIAVARDPECRNMTMNSALAEMFHMAPDANPAKSADEANALPFRIFREGSEVSVDKLPMQYAAANKIVIKEWDYDSVYQDGNVQNLSVNAAPLRDEDGKVRGCVGVFVDVTNRKVVEKALMESRQQLERANAELKRLAWHDALTGVANRRNFNERLAEEYRRAARERTPLSLVFVDVDFFKDYNDRYGHVAGDDCLVNVANLMQEHLRRPGDLLSRYGGEEFAILLPATEAHGACRLAELIRAAVEGRAISHAASRIAPVVTISLGVTTARPVPSDVDIRAAAAQFVATADSALYASKRRGRNRVTFVKS